MANILVVDDEQGFRQILSIILKRAGHQSHAVDSSQSARAYLATHTPDLIILDDNMPGESGGDFCRALKAEPTTTHIPVIMYSAGARANDSIFIRSIGANAAVKKPSMPQELTSAIDACLNDTAASV